MASAIETKLRHLEALLGKGPTLDARTRQLVLAGAVPLWLATAARLSGPHQKRAHKAQERLADLHREMRGVLEQAGIFLDHNGGDV